MNLMVAMMDGYLDVVFGCAVVRETFCIGLTVSNLHDAVSCTSSKYILKMKQYLSKGTTSDEVPRCTVVEWNDEALPFSACTHRGNIC